MGLPTQEYWSGLPFPSLGDLPDSGIKPGSPALQADSLPLSHQGSLIIRIDILRIGDFPDGSQVRNLPIIQETQEIPVPSMGGKYPLKKEMATHSNIFARKVSWTKEPGGLQSMESKESDMAEHVHIFIIRIELNSFIYAWYNEYMSSVVFLGK